METDSMKYKYNFEPFIWHFILSREDWIRGPKAPIEVQWLIWFTDGSRSEEGTEIGLYGPKTRFFFSMSTKIYKRRFWQATSLSLRDSTWGIWRGSCFTRDFERQVKEGSGNYATFPMGALRG
jgi:hypothetical protein